METVNKRNPIASVIIPIHDRFPLVDETIASVHAQTYRPIELILVMMLLMFLFPQRFHLLLIFKSRLSATKEILVREHPEKRGGKLLPESILPTWIPMISGIRRSWKSR